MSEIKPQGSIMLNNVRLAFPSIFKPSRFDEASEPRFQAIALLPPDHPDVKKIKKTLQQVAQAKWQDKAEQILKQLVAQDKTCLHNGDNKPEYDGFAGNLYISANSKVRPLVIDRNREPLDESDGRPYSGCYVNMKIDIWAQANNFGKRLNAQLQGVQFYKDGEAFSGGRPAEVDEFAEMDDVDESEEYSGEDASDAFDDLI